MFYLLKKKQKRDIVPPLKDNKGSTILFEKDNLVYVQQFFAKIFFEDPLRFEEVTKARAQVARYRKPTVTALLNSQLDSLVTKEEITENINSMANGKSPGIDGLPNEFYKTFQDLLAPFLLRIWE